MKVYNIIWKTDGYEVDLPKEIDLPNNFDEDRIADYLSDEYGFLVCSFHIYK